MPPVAVKMAKESTWRWRAAAWPVCCLSGRNRLLLRHPRQKETVAAFFEENPLLKAASIKEREAEGAERINLSLRAVAGNITNRTCGSGRFVPV